MSITIDRPRRSLRRTLASTATIALAAAAICVAVAAPASAHPVLHISASPTTVTAGNTVTLTISGTSNGNYTNARIEVFAGTPSSGATTGSLTSFTSSPSCGGSPGSPSCAEITDRYKIGNINLTNGQAFSYTVTFTVDSATAAGTFTSKAQFYKSDNTTDGPTTGPLITVTNPTADLGVSVVATSSGLTNADVAVTVTNNGPGTLTTATYEVHDGNVGLEIVSTSGASCSSPVGYSFADCTIGSLAPSAQVTFHVVFGPDLFGFGSVDFEAFRQSSTPADPNSSNDVATDTCTEIVLLYVC